MASRLALGTAQFGLRYGVANRGDRVRREEVQDILALARHNGIDTLDTAVAYGDSERLLGELGLHDLKIVSKVPSVPTEHDSIDTWLVECVRGSLVRLGVAQLYGLLLHRPSELHGPHGDALWRGLTLLKREGTVEKIGISIYDPSELESLIPKFDLDLVQAPLNVLDQRLIRSGWLSRLSDAGKEIHVRSVFLQGLLLMGAAERPARFSRWSNMWKGWDRWLREEGLTAVQACLAFAGAVPHVGRIVVGVDSREQLAEIVGCASRLHSAPPKELTCDDLELIEPSRWGTS